MVLHLQIMALIPNAAILLTNINKPKSLWIVYILKTKELFSDEFLVYIQMECSICVCCDNYANLQHFNLRQECKVHVYNYDGVV